MFKKVHTSIYCFLIVTLFMVAGSSYAQATDTLYDDSLCAYTWNSDINDCPEVLECIFPVQWNDTTILVQENISHISRDGLKLCLENLNLVIPADIIYIIDYSGSMQSDYTVGGVNQSGDRYQKRDDALEAGFSYQINNFPDSKAGYIAFGGNLVTQANYPNLNLQGDHILSPVNVNTGQSQLQTMVDYVRDFVDVRDETAGATNYYVALERAIEWIQDSTLCPHETKAIIFISDGEPTQGGNYPFGNLTNTLIAENVPVHGIYVGRTNAIDLNQLVDATGGTSWIVPQQNTDTLANVVLAIIQTIQKDFEPTSINVTNLDNGSSADAINNLWNLVDDSVWTGPLSKPVALKPNLNEIQLTAVFQTTDQTMDTSLTFKFFINVGGEPDFSSECFYCWYRSQLEVRVNNVVVDTLTWENTEYTINFYYYGLDTLDQVDVVVKTTQKGDNEIVTITDWSYDGEKFTYTATVPFAVLGTSQGATNSNGVTESDYEDLVTLFWQHPEEVMDTAYTEVIVSAPPNHIEIHDVAGEVARGAASKYATAPEVDTVTAGILAELYAKVFANDKWLGEYETNNDLSQLITWNIVNAATGVADPTIGTLSTNNNSHNSFFPIKAYHTVDITASLVVPGLGTISETIRLYIKPGEPKMTVIEATNDITQTANLNERCDWSPIEIFGNQTDISVYGVLRDSLGNWVRPAEGAMWTVDDQTVVSVDPGPDDSVNVHKETQPNGQTLLHSVESPYSEDTAVVITYPYVIDAIRIVFIDNNGDYQDITNLSMNTNQDTTLYVLGLRSDNGEWILIDADWHIDPMATEQTPPVASSHWFFSPARPDTGIIFATFSSHSDTVNYYFTVGPPIEVSFVIITPDSLLIAGQTILGVVTIKNEDGLVPGVWKYEDPNDADYTDILDNGFNDPINPIHQGWDPFAKTEEDSAIFADRLSSIDQWFNDGVDTLEFVLYYAPVDESPHKLTVTLGSLSASTDPFVLLPGPLDTIALDPDTLPPLTTNDPAFIITARGYDQFGNRRPNDIFSWSNDPSLVDFSINARSIQVYIDPSNATKTQEGYIIVTGIKDTTITNRVYIKIFGPLPYLLRAVTRDYSGNGFLDAIDLYFNKTFTMPPNIDFGEIIVQYNSETFNVTGMTMDANDNRKFLLHLSEAGKSRLSDDPETAWTPLITIKSDALDSIREIDRVTCEDGAAPVIWDVFKEIKDISNRAKDVVTVKLSEDFFNYNGSSFMSAGPEPQVVFYVWERRTDVGDTVRVDSILAGIRQFNNQNGVLTTFNMTNGANLNANHFMNLDHIQGYVADQIGNTPNQNNQKVQVRITGQIGDIRIAPNPIIPNLSFFRNNQNNPIGYIHPDIIYNIIQQNGGVLITIDLNGIDTAQVLMMVFDAVGNLVYSNESDKNIIDECPQWMQDALRNGTDVVQLPLYWHGVTSRGMKSAPGVYRLIVFVNGVDIHHTRQKLKFPTTVAVGRN